MLLKQKTPTWDWVSEMFLEPFKEMIESGEYLTSVTEPIHSDCHVLMLGPDAGHVGEEEFS